MAVRIHVAAARGTSLEALRGALGLDAPPQAGETNGWTWAMASVWHVDEQALDKGLLQLPGPALRVTTSDGVCWRLHLFAGGKETFRTNHQFTFCDPAAWEELEEDLEDGIEEVVEDLDLPKPLVRQLKKLPFQEAMRALIPAHAALIADGLREAGIPHDREAILAVLRGENVPEREMESDLGNLPRFLALLGMDDLFAAWEAEDEDGDEEEEGEVRSVLAGILAPLADKPAVPIEGGAVALAAADLPWLWYIPWCCDTEVVTAVTVALPGGAGVPAGMANEEHWTVEETETGFGIAIPWRPLGWMRGALREVVGRIRGLPAGSVVALVTANDDEEHTAGNQRFRGVLEKDGWRLEAAYPPVPAARLREALELFRHVEAQGPFPAASEAEAEVVVAAAARSDWFSEATLPRRKGRQVDVSGDSRAHLAMMFFRQRFRDSWNVAEGEAEDEGSHASWDEMMDGLDELAEALALPASDEVVLEGRGGVFRRAAVESLPEHTLAGAFEGLFDRLYETGAGNPPPTRQELAAAANEAMVAAGFAHLGDMVCDRFGEVLVRGYAAEAQPHTYGVLLFSGMGEFHEFYTAFADGSSLTTTTVPGGKSEPKRRIFKKCHPDVPPAALLRRHVAEVEKRAQQGKTPRPAEPTLRGLAEAIDEYVVRAGA